MHKLMTIELPRPEITYADHSYPAYSARQMKEYAELSVAAEREACASACDDLHHNWRFGDGEDSTSGPKECAEAIRARPNDKDRGASHDR